MEKMVGKVRQKQKPNYWAGDLCTKNSWTLSYQMNSLVVFDAMNVRHLLASQPGGTYAILLSSVLNKQEKVRRAGKGICFHSLFFTVLLS